MIISSPAFQDRKPLPTRFAYKGMTGGRNISPPLLWSDAPAATQSFALSIIDPHPVANNWVHWLVYNIPNHSAGIAEGASPKRMPAGAVELFNSFGEIGYGGPQPPEGSGPHPYVMTLYALSVDRLELVRNSTLSAFLKSIEDKILTTAKITGIYEQ